MAILNAKSLLDHKGIKNPISVAPTDSLSIAVEKLNQHDIGLLVVIENGAIVGVLSERDFIRRVLPKNIDIKQAKIAEFMTKDVVIVTTTDPISDCLKRLKERRLRHLPVSDENGVLQGVITERDITSFLLSRLPQAS